MHTLSAYEIKRRGVVVIEENLANGPIHIVKRNQPVCVVLSEEAYAQLIKKVAQGAQDTTHTRDAWAHLLSSKGGKLSKKAIDLRLKKERDGWD